MKNVPSPAVQDPVRRGAEVRSRCRVAVQDPHILVNDEEGMGNRIQDRFMERLQA
jgi:hypothetical protein